MQTEQLSLFEDEPETQTEADFSIELDAEGVQSGIGGSPVFYQGVVERSTFKDFRTLFCWSKRDVVKGDLNLNNIPAEVFQTWAANNHLLPLAEPDKAQKVLSLTGVDLAAHIECLSQEEKESLIEAYVDSAPEPTEQEMQAEWDLKMFCLGMELFSCLPPIRLGVGSSTPSYRTWRGRHASGGTVYCVKLPLQSGFEFRGKEFIKTYLGDEAINQDFCIEERAGLWRITITGPGNNTWYIEEFEDSHLD